MKKLITLFITIFITSSVYALSINDFTHNVDIGGGYTNSNLHIFSKNLNLKGPNAYISLEGNLTK
ncbi:MAG: hypothetical protein ACPKM0_01115, partial [Pleomorphochaeta sp.]